LFLTFNIDIFKCLSYIVYNEWFILNDELEKMCNKIIVAYFKLPSLVLNNLSKSRKPSVRNLTRDFRNTNESQLLNYNSG